MLRVLSTAAAVSLVVTPALAHTGVGGGVGVISGFAAGFTHPLFGLDHLLAMVTVGAWAALLGGRAVWLVPAAFVVAMVAGGALSLSGVALPMVETAIALSVVVLGALVAVNARVVLGVGMAIVAAFAVFHGHAHGSELPTGLSAAGYAVGFALATALLHAAGIALVAGLVRIASTRVVRFAGLATAAAGVAITAGL